MEMCASPSSSSRGIASLLLVLGLATGLTSAQSALPKLTQTIPLTDVEGRIDHFAVDIEGGRVFVAALGNGSVEVVDLSRGQRTGEIKDLKEPQGLVYLPASRALYVATGGDGMVRVYNGETLALAGSIALGDDADNLRYDAQRSRILAGYGEGAIASISLDLKNEVEVKLPAHPESFQFSSDGAHLYVNLPHDQSVAVIDIARMAVTARWPHLGAKSNFPMALDPKRNRVFIACRAPAQLLAVDANTGSVVERRTTVGDADDLFFDKARGRIYVIGGEGFIDVIDTTSGEFAFRGHVPTAPGARTGLFVPAWNKLLVAAPHRASEPARLLVYSLP